MTLDEYMVGFRQRTNLMIRERIRTRGANNALLCEIEYSMDEPSRWGAACMLAVFRNWSNRR